MKKGWNTGKLLAVTAGGIGGAVLLMAAFLLSVLQIAAFFSVIEEGGRSPQLTKQEEREPFREEEPGPAFPEEFEAPEKEPPYEEAAPEAGEDFSEEEKGEYYEFYDALRDDLSYQVSLEQEEMTEFPGSEGRNNVMAVFEYPVITGQDVINLAGVNEAVYREVEVIREYVTETAKYLLEEESYYFECIAYVTYMSEEILSVAYVEYGYMNGEFLESYVVPVNIDMQSGMVLDHTKLLEIDDQFSIEFRKRSQRQNGESSDLSYFSDQDITAYLTDPDYLILFYTPIGMEVGFNYYEGWVTVTYSDYKKYIKQL